MSSKRSNTTLTPMQKLLAMTALILAGESIFFLPYIIPRVFRPTLLEVFEINNLQIGKYFSVYGVIAIFSYLIGGPLADRFKPSRLMSFALFVTAIGGFYMYTLPSADSLYALYAFWGVSTILLFWAALLRTTRILAGNTQGLGFGLLDGGRGLISVLVSTGAAWLFASVTADNLELLDVQERNEGFKKVIFFFSCFVIFSGIFVFLALRPIDAIDNKEKLAFNNVKALLSKPAVWLQSLIIICAYSGYKVSDDFSLMAKDILGYSEADSAFVTTAIFWIRPISAIGAGLLADRISASKMITFCFSLMIIGGLSLGLGISSSYVFFQFVFVVVSTAIAVYALRGLYFAIMKEAQIPIHVTGTAVGLASIIGYLPDIFMGLLMGYILDNNPGVLGHQYLFLFLAFLSVVGLFVSLLFRKFFPASLQ